LAGAHGEVVKIAEEKARRDDEKNEGQNEIRNLIRKSVFHGIPFEVEMQAILSGKRGRGQRIYLETSLASGTNFY
jgi:hypothetical protein